MKINSESNRAGWLSFFAEMSIIILFAIIINTYYEEYFLMYIIFLIIGWPMLRKINNLRSKLDLNPKDIKREYKLNLKNEYFDFLINVGFGLVYIIILLIERPDSYLFQLLMITSLLLITIYLKKLEKKDRNRLVLTEKEVILSDGEITRIGLNNGLIVDRKEEGILRLENGKKELVIDLNRILKSYHEELISELSAYKAK